MEKPLHSTNDSGAALISYIMFILFVIEAMYLLGSKTGFLPENSVFQGIKEPVIFMLFMLGIIGLASILIVIVKRLKAMIKIDYL